MNDKIKTPLIISLLCANIAVMGFAGGSAVWMLKNSRKAEAAPESSAPAPESSIVQEESSLAPVAQIGEDGAEVHAVSEDEVTIGGRYHIRSTVQISDAYKSGDSSKLSDKDKETLQLASDVLKKITKDSMSDYEKEKAVYEWMVSSMTHDSGMMTVISTAAPEADSPHGVLKNKSGVCVGFATTFRLLMQMLNIECKVVHDSYLGHSWDLVKLGSHWYHTDIYSDIGSVSYSNFNMSDAMCQNTHTWDQEFFPKADSLEFNPAYRDRITVEDIYALPAAVRKSMEEQKLIQCYVIDQASLSERETVALNNMFEALRENCSEIYSDYYRLTLPTECGLGQEEGTGKPMAVVVFYDPNAGSSSYTAMDEDDRDKMNKALQKAFRGLCYVEIPEVEEMSFGDDDSSGNDNDNNSGSSSDNSSAADAEG